VDLHAGSLLWSRDLLVRGTRGLNFSATPAIPATSRCSRWPNDGRPPTWSSLAERAS